MAEPVLEAGTLLVAPPTLQDPNFRRSVVLLCDHSPEGTFGLLLNRMLELKLSEVLDDLLAGDAPLALGGPVQPNTLHFVHCLGAEVPRAVEVADGIFWGGDFDVVKALVRSGAVKEGTLRFFLGYAGWSPGQLEAEMEQSGWIVVPPSGAFVFPDDPSNLWRSVMRRLGGEYALLSNFPDNPRMN